MKLFVIVGALVVAVLGILLSTYQEGVNAEANLVSARSASRTELTTYTKKVKDLAQVPKIYVEDLTAVTKAEMQGRYGDKGSQGVLQFIKERNLPLTDAMSRDLMLTMAAGREAFKNSQNIQTDARVAYFDRMLKSPIKGTLLNLMGFPRLKEEDFREITTESVDEAFTTHRVSDEPIKLR